MPFISPVAPDKAVVHPPSLPVALLELLEERSWTLIPCDDGESPDPCAARTETLAITFLARPATRSDQTRSPRTGLLPMSEQVDNARAARSRKPATIYTVAEHAGVSHQTVSRFLKGEKLRPSNRERVERALAELDYQVNDVARALATRTSRRIGAFIFDVDDWAPQRVLSGAAEAAHRAGYILDIVRVNPGTEASINQAIRLMNRTTLAGVVVLSPSDSVLERLDLTRLRAPWVVEAERDSSAGGDRSLEHPFARVVEHLADIGHERFVHLGGPRDWLTARNRAAAYREVLSRRGLTNCGETEGEWSAAAGYEAMTRLSIDDAPTALVAASDQIALGALAWLRERGVRVPQDVSITGYDGIVDAAYYSPPLTTVSVDFAQLGRLTVEALLEHQGLGGRPDTADLQASNLVVRASTRAPGRGLPR